MLTLWNINDDDDNIVVIIIPREPGSLDCPVTERDTVPLIHWVVHGSGDVGVPVVPTYGRWSSFRAWLTSSSLLGIRSHPFGACLLGAGCRLPVVILFARGYQVFGRGASFWADKNLQCPLFSLENFVVSTFGTTKVIVSFFLYYKLCDICLTLQKFVVSTSWHYKILQCLLFSLQNLIVSSFFHYNSWSCPLFHLKFVQYQHFETTEICSLYILALQKFVVSTFCENKECAGILPCP